MRLPLPLMSSAPLTPPRTRAFDPCCVATHVETNPPDGFNKVVKQKAFVRSRCVRLINTR